jgi:hypothetical protein
MWVRFSGETLRWGEQESSKLMQERDKAVFDYESKIIELKGLINSGASFQGQALTWATFVRKMSIILGQVYTSLLTIKEEILEDPDMYAEDILNVQWSSLINNARSVLDIFGSKYSTDVLRTVKIESSSMMQAEIFSLESQAVGIQSSTNAVSNGDGLEVKLVKTQEERDEDAEEAVLLIDAIRALPVIAPELKDSLEDEDKFFKKISEIQFQPHVTLIKAFDNQKTATSLNDFCGSLVNSYAFAAQKRNRALNSLRVFALMQASGIERLAKGRKTWSAFAGQYTLRMTNSVHFAEKAYDETYSSHKLYRELYKSVQRNKDMFNLKAKELDTLIGGKRKVISDHNFQVAADGATLLVISAAAGLAIFKGPEIAFKAASAAYSVAGGGRPVTSISSPIHSSRSTAP